jgi:hypothetical protein
MIEKINIDLMLHEFSYKDHVHVVGPQCTGWDVCSTAWRLVVKVKVGGSLESNVEIWTLKC